MLSIENPPPDLSYPCERAQVKSSGGDERVSSDHKLAALQQEVDLFKLSGGVDACGTPLPKFSIRDYVCSSRSKDIKTNWPFSQRNLQLCLKHGVKDLLPPFQPLDSVRNQVFNKRCALPTSFLLEKEKEINVNSLADGHRKPSGLSTHPGVSTSTTNDDASLWNPKLDFTSCRSGRDKDLTTTATINQSQSEAVVESVPTKGLSSSPIAEAATSLEASVVERAAAGPPPASQKTASVNQHSGKKCRLIVKFGNPSDPNPTEDIISNCTALSEPMTSKICPVCKTFSSSSNTTLNAHIDQCLSVESTSKWAADSRLTKHRIKPRKTRLMVDICATAPCCTLEELDRRNGSSWAVDLKKPTQDPGVCHEGQRPRVSPIYPEDNGDEGAVYIDATGTKLRILSKFNDVPSGLQVGKNPRPGKALRKGKGSKFLSVNKRRYDLPKHHKYLKLAPHSKKFGSSKAFKFEEGNSEAKETRQKKQHLSQLFKAQEQLKNSDSGTLRQGVCSKRSGLSKKFNNKDIHQLSGYKLHMTRDLLDDSDHHCHSDSHRKRSCLRKSPNSSQNPISSPENSGRVENSKYEARVNGRECSPTSQRGGIPLFGARVRSLEALKENIYQSSKDSSDSTSMHGSCMLNLPKFPKDNVSKLNDKTVKIAGQVRNSGSSSHVCTKPYWCCHEFSSESMRLSGLREDTISVGKSSVPVHKSNTSEKYSTHKKPRVHFTTEIDGELEAEPSKGDQQYDLMCNNDENESHEEVTETLSLAGCSVVYTRPDIGSPIISRWEEAMVMRSSPLASQFYDHDMREKIVSSAMTSDGSAGKVDSPESSSKEAQFFGKEASIDPPSSIAVGGNMMSLSKSLDPEYPKLVCPFDTELISLQSMEKKCKEPLCTAEAPRGLAEPSLGHGCNLFCAGEVGDGIVGQNTHMRAELDPQAMQGNFSEVEPIPIPGPPGSYLPSPRDMSSEDFQGNSSLTTSRVHSSQDKHELVDVDSSDSPISATSTLSNSTLARSSINFSEQLLSAGPPAIQDRISSGFLDVGIEPTVVNESFFPQTVSQGMKRTFSDGENLKDNVIIPEKGPLGFTDDGHPCCCTRKEKISQSIALNYQDSQLLRRRAMAMGKQVGWNPNARTNNPIAGLEMVSQSSCTSSGSEKVPVTRSPAGPATTKISSDAAVRFSSHGDCDSASPSASSPILRLMGKNLMVANKDDDASTRPRQAEPVVSNNSPSLQFPTISGVSSGSNQTLDYHSFHCIVSQLGSVIFGQDPQNPRGDTVDAKLSKDLRSQLNSKTLDTPTRAAAGIFLNKINTEASYSASFERHRFKGECNLLTQHDRPKNGWDAAAACDIEKVIASPVDSKFRKTNSTVVSNKEIIVIDDVPESEAGLMADDAKHTKSLRGSQPTLGGISSSAIPGYKSRHVVLDSLPRCDHQYSQDPSTLSEHSTAGRGRTSTRPLSWGYTSEASGAQQQRKPFVVPSAARRPPRSALYYSPSQQAYLG
ncbi:uncharacterized protein LOC131168417 isoform X2 [Malania oleifera]|uniref:uncharacterized protein LOC131168417 isoform X2 n=1 Tax=Malania oleifera TaxID=397392 RepID=UPI0025ADF07D|nr:uncharacterized protein LOC131168417 isoform X2 [Malania oleifera]XP_057983832.1 uncharacterized protein LOC131168417 isoform X2 [Malania oleifera]